MEFCPLHDEFSKDVKQLLQTAILNKTHIDEIYRILGEINVSVKNHVNEADKQGGIRDRVNQLEIIVSTLKKSYWKVGLTSGMVGALIGHLTPTSIKLIAMFFKLHFGT